MGILTDCLPKTTLVKEEDTEVGKYVKHLKNISKELILIRCRIVNDSYVTLKYYIRDRRRPHERTWKVDPFIIKMHERIYDVDQISKDVIDWLKEKVSEMHTLSIKYNL